MKKKSKSTDDLALEVVDGLKALLDRRGKGELASATFDAGVLETWLRFGRNKDHLKQHRNKASVRLLAPYVAKCRKLFSDAEWNIVREEITMFLLARLREHCANHILELRKEQSLQS